MRKLGEVLRAMLLEMGVDAIGTLSKKIPKRGSDPFQGIAVALYEGRGFIGRVPDGAHLAWKLSGERVERAGYAFIPMGLSEKFEAVLTPGEFREVLEDIGYPLFIIDLMHWDKHTPREKKKVAFQVSRSYGTMREYLHGGLLRATWANDEFRSLLKAVPDVDAISYPGTTVELLRENGIEEVVLLDPRGEGVLGEEDFSAGAFIIGGIVDMGGTKKGTTAKIGDALEAEGIRVRRRRLELRGDVIGVPDRIPLILEALLKMLTEGKDMERAVLEVQEPKHARWRLRKELPKRVIRYIIDGKRYHVVELESFEELGGWLNIRWEDFVQVLRELNFAAIERKRIHNLNRLSNPRIINGKLYRVVLLKKAAMLCYNC
ncbi:tRNA (guanine(9)-/adenine(9)-N1)-methyltransferase [Palaeococcus ferrophilus]|uniref:tRNA (guanine(9)-/adenine(9)-N1)-methyltransferase n=1 Tax=Palaeococcus ferrophilus TaxID=83868 RepID=UPI00064E31F7|nr:tRNA (guanine(9)-/adenine(9)-N1)-methyltransferase [Palaeococcus ferrophilus]